MAYRHILLTLEDGVALIRFNRPGALNALTPAMVDELSEALDCAAADEAVRAIVLTGEGRGFCSGADLVDTRNNPRLDAQGRLDVGAVLEAHYNPLILKMRALPKPIISAVNGMAAGVGATLALVADLTLAGRSAYFLQAFVNVGLIPDGGGTWLLPRAVGPQRAMGMALLGEKLPATQARDWGLIWDVVDDEQLLPSAMALARRLANGPAGAIARIKQTIHAAAGNSLEQQLVLERELQRECGLTADFEEGTAAFVEKRKANFNKHR